MMLYKKDFKARYFLRIDIFKAHIGHNLSYYWRSLWVTRAHLKEGGRWATCNESHILVWMRFGYVMTLVFHVPHMKHNVKQWNTKMTNIIFLPNIA